MGRRERGGPNRISVPVGRLSIVFRRIKQKLLEFLLYSKIMIKYQFTLEWAHQKQGYLRGCAATKRA